MAAVIERNATKSAGGGARRCASRTRTSPARTPSPSETGSVGSRSRPAPPPISGLLYDSLEAPPDAPLSIEEAPAVVEAIRGDSHWLDIRADRAVDPRRAEPAEPVAAVLVQPDHRRRRRMAVAAGVRLRCRLDEGHRRRRHHHARLRRLNSPTTTRALIGCHVELDHLFELGVWEPDPKTGEIDRAAIDRAVREAFETYDVVGFYSDVHPWESYVDRWAEELGTDLIVKASPRQPIGWDMRSRLQQFTHACERLHDAIVENAVTHDGAAKMRRHFHNARRRPNRFGIGVGKEHRESARKIDAVPAAVLARLARLEYLALPESRRRKKRSGIVW
jgi:hypothetical protein